MSEIELSDKFMIVEHQDDPSLYGIALTQPEYKGIIYRYGKVDLAEQKIVTTEDMANINFEYEVLNNSTDVVVEGNIKLQQLMGEILVSMIKDTLEQKKIEETVQQDDTEESEGMVFKTTF